LQRNNWYVFFLINVKVDLLKAEIYGYRDSVPSKIEEC